MVRKLKSNSGYYTFPGIVPDFTGNETQGKCI